jgi:hypothetical protein
MRSLEFKNVDFMPFIEFDRNIQDAIGQEPHEMPTVFSFFRPEFRPSGRINSAQLVSPESQVLNGPMGINLLNMMISLIKYGLNDCYGGFGDNHNDKDGSASSSCRIGTTTHYGALTTNFESMSTESIIDDLATLLTSGRLSSESRNIIKQAFEDTLSNGYKFSEAVVNAQQLVVVSPEFHASNIPFRTGAARTAIPKPPATNIPYKSAVFLMLSGGAGTLFSFCAAFCAACKICFV